MSEAAPHATPGHPDLPDPAGSRAAEAGGPYLTARQTAAYLQLNEKKLYELANSRDIPAIRLGGKWLFPRRLLDDWLLEQAHGGVLTDRLLLAGCGDALLAAAVAAQSRALGADAFVAFNPTDAMAGLALLSKRRVNATALAWGCARHSDHQHASLMRAHTGHTLWTLIRIALREQGVLLRPGLGPARLDTLAGFDVRWAMRPPGSSTGHFLASALADHGFRTEDCSIVATAFSAPEAASLVLCDEADCAPGTRATAHAHGLDFLSLGWEALDLVLPRELFFRHLFQHLLDTLASPEIRAIAARLGGYDLSPLGEVRTAPATASGRES